MSRDLGALRSDVVAERAAVRLLARVRPSVHDQVGLLREVLTAELAGVVSQGGIIRGRSRPVRSWLVIH